jgi:protein phosphatase
VFSEKALKTEGAATLSLVSYLPQNTGIRFQFGRRSDLGGVRQNNEDSILILENTTVFESIEHTRVLCAVADGVGGAQKGEVASRLTLQTLESKASDIFLQSDASSLGDHLKQVIEVANEAVLKHAVDNPESEGMATTLVVVTLDVGLDRQSCFVAHVGDSRAYVIDDLRIRQLTNDHSEVQEMVDAGTLTPEEARHDPRRNVITRAIGADSRIEASVLKCDLGARDRILLCTDGLWELVSDEEMHKVVLSAPSLQSACDQLVSLANKRGGKDNISITLVGAQTVSRVIDLYRSEKEKRSKKVQVGELVLLSIVLAGISFLVYVLYDYFGLNETFVATTQIASTAYTQAAQSPITQQITTAWTGSSLFWTIFAALLASLLGILLVLRKDLIGNRVSPIATHKQRNPATIELTGSQKVRCMECGAQNEAESEFCNKCNRPLKQIIPTLQTERRCGRCGAPVSTQSKFCKKCGSPLWSAAFY